jgi:IPT/TIG domain
MNTKIKCLILGFIILIVTSVYLISQQEIEPPPATLKIDGKEQISGIGSYCWSGTWKALCADMVGIPTAQEPLIASPTFTAHLRLPLQDPPYELRLDVIRVKYEDELNLSARSWRWWDTRDVQRKNFILPFEPEQDIELSLEPGLYVLSIGAWWKEKGSASYGFLVKVQANGTSVVPTTPVSPVNQTPPSLAITLLSVTVIQPDAGTIGTKVVITGTGFTARDNNVAFRRAPVDAPIAGYQVGYINNLISSDGRTIEFEIPELLGACAFPLPVTNPITGCPAVGIPFKPGNQTYPVFVVNQNGTSNGVNFTVSW